MMPSYLQDHIPTSIASMLHRSKVESQGSVGRDTNKRRMSIGLTVGSTAVFRQ